MAEAMVRTRADLAGSGLESASAGLIAPGQPPPPATLAVMRARGIDLSSHRSRVLRADMLDGVDLVLGMTREHVWEAALFEPDVVPRAFMLGEFVRLNQLAGGRKGGEPFDCWVHRLHASRQSEITLGSAADEVRDPFGRRRRVHARVADQIEQYVLNLADCAFDPVQADNVARWRERKLMSRRSASA